MTTASAKVIIDAEDLASKKMADAARNVERSIKSIKDTGRNAKASTEFVGTLANSLGGTELGRYAGQLAQLTDRVSQFSEVSRAGGAGALAFKAGLAAAVGVIAFQVGKAFGDVIFQTEKMTREFQRAKDAAAELNAEISRSVGQQFANDKEDIELIRDPEKKRAAQEALLKTLENNVQGITAQLKESTKAADEWADAWQITGDRKAYAEDAKKQVEIDKQRLAQAKAQRDEIRAELSDRKAINDQIRADNAAAERAEQEAIRAKEKAEQEALAVQKQVADEAEKAAQKRIDEAKRIADIRQNEIDRLKEEKILLTEGAEAAKRFALERQGVDKDSAARIAAEQAAIDNLRESLKDSKAVKEIKVDTKLTAVESRLQTRGRLDDPNAKVAENTKLTVKELERLNKREEAKTAHQPSQIVLEVASA